MSKFDCPTQVCVYVECGPSVGVYVDGCVVSVFVCLCVSVCVCLTVELRSLLQLARVDECVVGFRHTVLPLASAQPLTTLS